MRATRREVSGGPCWGTPLTFSQPITAPVTVYYAYVKAGTAAAAGSFSFQKKP